MSRISELLNKLDNKSFIRSTKIDQSSGIATIQLDVTSNKFAPLTTLINMNSKDGKELQQVIDTIDLPIILITNRNGNKISKLIDRKS